MSARPEGSQLEAFISVDEAAEVLGMSVDWVYDRCADGTIPSYKFGAKRKLRVSELEEWAQKQASARMGTVTELPTPERRR